MRRKYLTFFLLLEAYAILLAIFRYAGGLQTDEAKYLLNIPYPHPPFFRGLMSLTVSLPGNELLWRIIFASLLVQCVWFFVDLGSVLTSPRRRALVLSWLLSTSILVQGGALVLVVLVACFAVFFLWAALRPEPLSTSATPLLALAWLLSLFTAYQAILFAPLVAAALLRSRISRVHAVAYLCIPVLLLVLYSLSNPLALASMVLVSSKDAALSVSDRLLGTARILLFGGSIVLAITGIIGIVSARRIEVVLAFALVLGYVALAGHVYYAILFTPLLVGGTFQLLCKRTLRPAFLSVAHAVAAFLVAFFLWQGAGDMTQARETMQALRTYGTQSGHIIIAGPFGHDWQYEAGSLSVRRYTDVLRLDIEEQASAFVCTSSSCDLMIDTSLWTRLPGAPVQTWVRR